MERIQYLLEKANKLPFSPGVYLMKDKTGKVIYVGKAKQLKNRVSQYFRNITAHNQKVYNMVIRVHDFDFIVVDSEFEALILECSLIKQYSPHYNILLKDDKGYSYIKITKEEYPRIEAAFQKDDPGARYVGPYISSFWVKQAVEEVCTGFGLPTCSNKFPRDFHKNRPCLNYHIGRCMGLCKGNVSPEEYGEIINSAVEYLEKDGTDLIRSLEERMNAAAEALRFEEAAKLRDRIKAIKGIAQHQKVIMCKTREADAIHYCRDGQRFWISVINIRKSRLVDKKDFPLELGESPEETLSEFMRSFYSRAETIPSMILLGEELSDAPLLEQLFTKIRGKKITISVPTKGEQRSLVEMAHKNAVEKLTVESDRKGRELSALTELGRMLGLAETPNYIESYDISNIGDAYMVGGMVVFEEGKPFRANYRKFAIQGQQKQDDYQAMTEVLTRRFTRFLNGDDDPAFGRKPDLILLDGGKGHLHVISELLIRMGLGDIPIFGMVKDSKHRTRAITAKGGEIAIAANRSVFTLVTSIQDEVHRYSISFQRQKHKKTALESELMRIGGIGEAKAKHLYQHFKTLTNIRNATEEELASVESITKTDALKIAAYFDDRL